ncbi:IPT/TIG domain-containing protein [Streptomyces sp. SS7]|uniref:IPT/TIG domain-containing protein n=1 Tax=Streptomyces sp. SS7 TaxID=3108485 RepID=UPI0030EF6EF6
MVAGNLPAPAYPATADTTTLATAPAQATGTVTVNATTSADTGTGGSLTYLAPVLPAATGISPSSGPTGDGTLLAITGSGFTDTTAVLIVGVPAAGFTVDDDTAITAITAPAPPGGITGPAAVTTKGGTGIGGALAYLGPVLPAISTAQPHPTNTTR